VHKVRGLRGLRFSIDQKVFSQAVHKAQRAAATQSTFPILSGIMLEITGNDLVLSATDYEISLQMTITGIDVEQPGVSVLPASILGDIIRRVPEDRVTLSVDSGNKATIKWGRSEVQINGFDPQEFPALPEDAEDSGIKLDPVHLKKAIQQTIFCAYRDETQPALTGLLFDFDDQHINVVATDGARMALKNLDVIEGHLEREFIVPAKSMAELSRLLDEVSGPVTLRTTGSQAFFMTPDMVFTSRLIDAQFPRYKQILPSDYSTAMTLDRGPFLATCDRCQLIASAQQGSPRVDLSMADELLLVRSASKVGKVAEEVAATVDGDPLDISYDVRYLLDSLKNIANDEVRFEFTGKTSISRMRPADDEERLFYILLPLQL